MNEQCVEDAVAHGEDVGEKGKDRIREAHEDEDSEHALPHGNRPGRLHDAGDSHERENAHDATCTRTCTVAPGFGN